MLFLRSRWSNIVLFLLWGIIPTSASLAAIKGPYGSSGNPIDASTTHLWHLDEATTVTPAVDSGSVPLPLAAPEANSAILGNSSFRPAYGTALNTVDGGYDASTTATKNAGAFGLTPATSLADNVSADGFFNPTTGAFTLEALVQLSFNPTVPPAVTNRGSMMIMTLMDDTAAGDASARSQKFQFYYLPQGSQYAPTEAQFAGRNFLGFEAYRDAGEGNGFIAETIYAQLPNAGAHAPAQDGWYHVAVSYNGQEAAAGNLQMFWTRMDGWANTAAEPTQANALNTSDFYFANDWTFLTPDSTLDADIGVGPLGTADFGIGNEAFSGPNNNFVGIIDEARVSNVARAATDFLFGNVAPAVPGDFDADGDVDGADFVAWQTNFPTSSGATLAQGDADSDGDVDGADFVVWQTNFPFTAGPGTTPVPEPSSIIVTLIGIVCFAFCFSRLRQN